MQVNTNKLKGYIAASGMTQEAVAKAIGVDSSTFSRKLKCNGLTFSIGQMHKLVDVLSIPASDATAIFLCQNAQKCE